MEAESDSQVGHRVCSYRLREKTGSQQTVHVEYVYLT